MNQSQCNGISFVCRSGGTIRKVLQDGIGVPDCQKDALFPMMASTEDSGKALDFFEHLKSNGTALGWPLQVKTDAGLQPLVFSGARIDRDFVILAFSGAASNEELLEQLMKVNNEQMNSLRRELKNRSLRDRSDRNDSDSR